ncbi:MAG TPA: enoyl-CoA hydratase [Dehalococcoidia bacterium]|nr:enoyl-CoA hydratase [Dehalococcoidia bacterium]
MVRKWPYKSFIFTVEGGIATVRLNRPAQLNALTFETYEELGRMAFDLREDDTVKVLVLTGEGRGFCSGGDVHDIMGRLLEADSRALIAFQRMAGRVTKGLLSLRKPTIAAVNGYAAGAGAVIAVACDIRIAAERARFAFLFPRVGLPSSDLGACWLLPRVVGLGKAAELLLTGDTIDAQEAERIGMVNKVVPDKKLEEAAMDLASRLAGYAPLSNAMTKELIYKGLGMDFNSAIDWEGWLMSLAFHTDDGKEGQRAAGEKRPPLYQGK